MTAFVPNRLIATATESNISVKTDGATISVSPEPKVAHYTLNLNYFDFEKLISKKSNPIILKAGIDGFSDTFDEVEQGQRILVHSILGGATIESCLGLVMKCHRNDLGHVGSIILLRIKRIGQ